MKAIAEIILHHLDKCPIPSSNSKWRRYAYELVLGASASLISAERYFVEQVITIESSHTITY
jgi:hypothetical protein